LAVAADNAIRHDVADRIDFIEVDVLPYDSGNFDILCSNPPYITDDQYALLPEGIRGFEPHEALLAGKDGLDFYRRIVTVGTPRLRDGGRIFFEVGEGQASAVGVLLDREGCYANIFCRRDYGGVERVVSAQKQSYVNGKNVLERGLDVSSARSE
jgi:release factor glutamine methyltransferase